MSERDYDDKATWGDGPWLAEPDRLEWRAHGLPCLIKRGPMGAWCGYVAVPPGHPWHGRDYESVDAYAHGGLTYASKCAGDICHVPQPGESDDVWWLGFDCGHADDLLPRLEASLNRPSALGGEYRDQAYVQRETEALAAQAAAVQAVPGFGPVCPECELPAGAAEFTGGMCDDCARKQPCAKCLHARLEHNHPRFPCTVLACGCSGFEAAP